MPVGVGLGLVAGAAWSLEQRLWWLLWGRVPGLGYTKLCALWERFGSLEAAWQASVADLASVSGLGTVRLASIERCRARWGVDPLPALRRSGERGLGVLLPGDPALPAAVRTLGRPPLGLYWQGLGNLWAPLRQRRAVAVVGTRRPSPHGLAMAEAIGAGLARAGWPVVSGLAEGIDGAAHHGCLRAGGRPVGVLGTALERIYPQHHHRLQRQVGERGLLISEQAPGSSICAGHFAARNRLQVALASALVLVECPARSGALQATRMAWQQGLPVWVVPADAGKHSAAGSNAFLRRGVTPLLDPTELAAALGPGPLAAAGLTSGVGTGARGRDSNAPDLGLMTAVGSGASLDQLSLQLQQTAAELLPRLLALELAGRLQAEPGLRWRPA
ncbi:MAG: DNA-processing protein DprA [Cyanobacteria bacterium K_DeepCast_35m_m2_023]|nr:DNA-processing protein DprA [Cyanobacteria bacterium K_DeepCast_35m_m2_023]